jgi:hypothetical protein
MQVQIGEATLYLADYREVMPSLLIYSNRRR